MKLNSARLSRAVLFAMVTCFQMVGRLMSDILRGPRLPLRPSLTEEQFICQRLPALLRYLIPPYCRRPAGPHGESTHSLIAPKSIKWVAGEGSWGAQEQVSTLNSCNQLLTEESKNGTVLQL